MLFDDIILLIVNSVLAPDRSSDTADPKKEMLVHLQSLHQQSILDFTLKLKTAKALDVSQMSCHVRSQHQFAVNRAFGRFGRPAFLDSASISASFTDRFSPSEVVYASSLPPDGIRDACSTAAFDRDGILVAVGFNNGMIKVFDCDERLKLAQTR